MNWAAEQQELDPSLRKQLYEILEKEQVLSKSKDPWKDALKYAKELKKKMRATKREKAKSASASERAGIRGTHRKLPEEIEELPDDFLENNFDTEPETTGWFDDDLTREDYGDLYDNDY